VGSEAEGTAGVEVTEEAGAGAASQEVVIVEAGVGSGEEGETAEAGEDSQPGEEVEITRGKPLMIKYYLVSRNHTWWIHSVTGIAAGRNSG